MKNKLIELRKLTGLNQSQFAEKVNCTSRHISQMETGKSAVTIKTLQKYAEILDVKIYVNIIFKTKRI
jgi:transcriptional regulator with XRE-family HTH domain